MSEQMTTAAPELEVYAVGLCYASVCSSLDVDETTRRLNVAFPSGVGDWTPSGDSHFRGGQPNPCPCDRNPGTHKHYLFEC